MINLTGNYSIRSNVQFPHVPMFPKRRSATCWLSHCPGLCKSLNSRRKKVCDRLTSITILSYNCHRSCKIFQALTIHYLLKIRTMSREAYQVPSMGGGNEGGFTSMAIDSPSVVYICGECSAQVALKRGDPIRCKDCGHRVLYKERTKRYVWPLWA